MTAMFSTVMVPLDGSEEAAVALGPAGAVAHYLDLSLHVVARSEGPDDSALMTTLTTQMSVLGDIDRRLDLAALEGSVADEIVAALEESAGQNGVAAGPPEGSESQPESSAGPLLVMSTHGRGRSAGILGSVATEVLSRAAQPVLLFGPGYQRGRFRLHGPMLVAAAEDDLGESAVEAAAGLVRTFDYVPCVVNVVDPQTSRRLEKSQGGAFDTGDVLISASARRLAKTLAEASGARDLDYRVLVDRKPARAVAEHAEAVSAALVVVGTHARSGWDLLTRGSVTADIVAGAPCGVLAVAPGT